MAATLALVVGGIAIVAWILRLGFVSDLLSHPILVGYLCGVAIIMIVGQLEKATGVPVEGDTLPPRSPPSFATSADVHVPTLAMGVGILAFLLLVQRWFPRLPGPLLAVLLRQCSHRPLQPHRQRDRSCG